MNISAISSVYIADIHDKLQIRTFRWLGQLARQHDVTATKRLLSAWIATPRRCGAPHTTARSTYAETLCTILGPAWRYRGGYSLRTDAAARYSSVAKK
jgi:hypothetical protein